MMVGNPPFRDKNRKELYRKILHDKPPFPTWLSSTACGFIRALLEKTVDKRLGCGGIKALKSHPFFAGLDWRKLEQRQLPPPIHIDLADALDVSNFDQFFTDQPATIDDDPNALAALQQAALEAAGGKKKGKDKGAHAAAVATPATAVAASAAKPSKPAKPAQAKGTCLLAALAASPMFGAMPFTAVAGLPELPDLSLDALSPMEPMALSSCATTAPIVILSTTPASADAAPASSPSAPALPPDSHVSNFSWVSPAAVEELAEALRQEEEHEIRERDKAERRARGEVLPEDIVPVPEEAPVTPVSAANVALAGSPKKALDAAKADGKSKAKGEIKNAPAASAASQPKPEQKTKKDETPSEAGAGKKQEGMKTPADKKTEKQAQPQQPKNTEKRKDAPKENEKSKSKEPSKEKDKPKERTKEDASKEQAKERKKAQPEQPKKEQERQNERTKDKSADTEAVHQQQRSQGRESVRKLSGAAAIPSQAAPLKPTLTSVPASAPVPAASPPKQPVGWAGKVAAGPPPAPVAPKLQTVSKQKKKEGPVALPIDSPILWPTLGKAPAPSAAAVPASIAAIAPVPVTATETAFVTPVLTAPTASVKKGWANIAAKVAEPVVPASAAAAPVGSTAAPQLAVPTSPSSPWGAAAWSMSSGWGNASPTSMKKLNAQAPEWVPPGK
jgi:hypothetical protein